ncbi:MAG: tetratricopeptide repeat protein [Pseudomonadota bacterium]
MAENYTDDEQLENIKNWFKENGRPIMIGVFLSVCLLGGWKGMQLHEKDQSTEASTLYMQLHDSLADGDIDQATKITSVLQDSFQSTPYSKIAALKMAHYSYKAGVSSDAEKHLNWIIQNTTNKIMIAIAQIRLARFYLAQEQYQDALLLLDKSYPESFTSLVEELKGDAYIKQKNIPQAMEAYGKSISFSSDNNEYLIMKLNDAMSLASTE